MSRYFTIEQASGLLPRLEPQVRQMVHLKQVHDQMEADIQATRQQVHLMGGMLINRDRMLANRSRRDAAAMRLRELIEEVQQSGCQIKDLDTGLLDFPTLFRGREVLLCWRLGETAIEFWHSTEDGFRGRKPIDQDFLDNHQGDPAS